MCRSLQRSDVLSWDGDVTSQKRHFLVFVFICWSFSGTSLWSLQAVWWKLFGKILTVKVTRSVITLRVQSHESYTTELRRHFLLTWSYFFEVTGIWQKPKVATDRGGVSAIFRTCLDNVVVIQTLKLYW